MAGEQAPQDASPTSRDYQSAQSTRLSASQPYILVTKASVSHSEEAFLNPYEFFLSRESETTTSSHHFPITSPSPPLHSPSWPLDPFFGILATFPLYCMHPAGPLLYSSVSNRMFAGTRVLLLSRDPLHQFGPSQWLSSNHPQIVSQMPERSLTPDFLNPQHQDLRPFTLTTNLWSKGGRFTLRMTSLPHFFPPFSLPIKFSGPLFRVFNFFRFFPKPLL